MISYELFRLGEPKITPDMDSMGRMVADLRTWVIVPDPDSGLPHIVKAMAGLAVLRDSMINGNWNDDRPPPVADTNWVAELNAAAVRLLGRYPNPKAPHVRSANHTPSEPTE